MRMCGMGSNRRKSINKHAVWCRHGRRHDQLQALMFREKLFQKKKRNQEWFESVSKLFSRNR